MTKHKKHISTFRAYPENEKFALKLKIFSSIFNRTGGERKFLLKDIVRTCEIGEKTVEGHIQWGMEKRFIGSENNDLSGFLEMIPGKYKFLGISLEKNKCFLTVIDLEGAVIENEMLSIGYVPGGKLKKRQISDILEEIKNKSEIPRSGLHSSGFSLPLGFNRDNPGNSVLFAEEISRIFECNVFITNEATAAGYCECVNTQKLRGKGILYLYLDIGVGAVFKDDVIFEAGEIDLGKEIRYLRPWEQFSVVKAAKKLIGKGLGTTIVRSVGGNVNDITLEIILNAADEGDELAGDLVKRASYALGVRAAYLVNMFDVETIVLGGGTEGEKGKFRDMIRESVNKFVMKKKADDLEVLSGETGKEAPSRGAALLCRRELFMEV